MPSKSASLTCAAPARSGDRPGCQAELQRGQPVPTCCERARSCKRAGRPGCGPSGERLSARARQVPWVARAAPRPEGPGRVLHEAGLPCRAHLLALGDDLEDESPLLAALSGARRGRGDGQLQLPHRPCEDVQQVRPVVAHHADHGGLLVCLQAAAARRPTAAERVRRRAAPRAGTSVMGSGCPPPARLRPGARPAQPAVGGHPWSRTWLSNCISAAATLPFCAPPVVTSTALAAGLRRANRACACVRAWATGGPAQAGTARCALVAHISIAVGAHLLREPQQSAGRP